MFEEIIPKGAERERERDFKKANFFREKFIT